jgi:ketosteroid isomerase-like protein
VRNTIGAGVESFTAGFSRGDAAGLAALYTGNGQVLPSNGNFVTGRQPVETFWQAVMDMGIKEAQIEILEVEVHGDTAIEVSRFALLGDG